jgi:hypothetical protein
MAEPPRRAGDFARVALAGIRLVNGCLGLFAPAWLVRRLGADPEANPAALYALRLFGVRTVAIGGELLLPAGPVRDHALRVAPVIHAADTVAAAIGGLCGQLPRRVAVTTVLVSAVNTGLAVLARSGRTGRPGA